MENVTTVSLYDGFEEKIKRFRENPSNFAFKYKNRILRQMQNSFLSYVVWLTIALLLNAAAYAYFDAATDKGSAASLIAITALFLTIGSRSYTVNLTLFKLIGNLGKLYTIHQLSNRIGFFHRFMALSALTWFVVHIRHQEVVSELSTWIGWVLLAMIVLVIASSAGPFRRKNHNIFENIHRYVGYSAMGLLIAYYFLSNLQAGVPLNETLIKPHFVLLLSIVAMLIMPWLGVKRVNPKLAHVGPHVVGIQIEGKPSFGTFSRITLANGYFHPFGDSMCDFDDLDNRTLYMTPAGDRTGEIVEAANNGEFLLQKCTIKKDRNCGFMFYHAVYDHVMIVVTGGGIAPIVPCLVLNDKTRFDVIWLVRSPVDEFTSELLGSLMDKIADKEIGIHILDTTDKDLEEYTNDTYINLIMQAHDHYNPEAVFVMSNQEFTVDVMNALSTNGIKTYGATYDS
jgi:hypothetical protein